MYRALDAVLLRASLHPVDLDLPPWPDLTGAAAAGTPTTTAAAPASPAPGREAARSVNWLRAVWSRPEYADAIAVASPDLAAEVERTLAGGPAGPRQVRRTVSAVTRYLLRMASRATPFGLFAGVAAAAVGGPPAVRWGAEHGAILRAEGSWLASIIGELESSPSLRRQLLVQVSDLVRDEHHRVVLPGREREVGAPLGAGGPDLIDVEVRRSRPVAAVLEHARTPVTVTNLVAKLAADFSSIAAVRAEALVAELIQLGILRTSLRAPMAVPDALGHLIAELDAVAAAATPELAATAAALRDIHDRISEHNTGRPSPAHWRDKRGDLVDRMTTIPSAGAGRPVATGSPIAVDVRLDVDVALPAGLLEEAARAAAALTRLTPYPYGPPAWTDYHEAFLERYGCGAVVPLAEVIDPDAGLGLPATFRGSDRTVTAAPVADRDRLLMRLAQQAAVRGETELVLTDRLVDELAADTRSATGATTGRPDVAAAAPGARLGLGVVPPPHVELFVQVHADSVAALARETYDLVVTGAARAAGTTTGRFLDLLRPRDLARFERAYSALGVARTGASAAQLSVPPLQARLDHLARAWPVMPTCVQVAGGPVRRHPAHNDRGPVGYIGLEDLAVGGDVDGLYLVSLSRRQLVEPTALNAVEFRFFSHPVARFLCEVTRASAAVYMPWSWGAAGGLPFLPRVRHRRTVLALARWTLTEADLPAGGASWLQWEEAFTRWQQDFRLPDAALMVEADNLLRLDLTEPLHRQLLRTQLDRHGHVRLDEAPLPGAYGWLDGHAHELVIPLTTAVPGRSAPPAETLRVLDRDVLAGQLPGASSVLYAKLYASPARHAELLDQVPDLIAALSDPLLNAGRGDLAGREPPEGKAAQSEPLPGPGVPALDWWFLPYRDPEPHLRVRIRLPDTAGAAAAGAAVATLGQWARALRGRGLLGRLQLETYHPETGRYGWGAAMTAAEHLFVADSAAALAQRRIAAGAGLPAAALTAASMVDLAISLVDDVAAGMDWLIRQLAREPGPDLREERAAAVRLCDPADDWAAIRAVDPAGALLAAWRRRRAAVSSYRTVLAGQRDPLSVLPALLHVHCVRAHGIDPDQERTCRRLSRAAALRWVNFHPGRPVRDGAW